MTDGNENGCVRNYDGARGADVLERLETVLRNTPPHALATPPLSRMLLKATVGEILTPCIVAGLVGVVEGMLILSAFSAIILWAATAMAGRIDEEQDID